MKVWLISGGMQWGFQKVFHILNSSSKPKKPKKPKKPAAGRPTATHVSVSITCHVTFLWVASWSRYVKTWTARGKKRNTSGQSRLTSKRLQAHLKCILAISESPISQIFKCVMHFTVKCLHRGQANCCSLTQNLICSLLGPASLSGETGGVVLRRWVPLPLSKTSVNK